MTNRMTIYYSDGTYGYTIYVHIYVYVIRKERKGMKKEKRGTDGDIEIQGKRGQSRKT